MKIKLAEGIIEKSNGEMHWHSKDQPFDVDARVGQDLIKSGDFEEVKDVGDLDGLSRSDLNKIGDGLGLESASFPNKGALIVAIAEARAELPEKEPEAGVEPVERPEDDKENK